MGLIPITVQRIANPLYSNWNYIKSNITLNPNKSDKYYYFCINLYVEKLETLLIQDKSITEQCWKLTQ